MMHTRLKSNEFSHADHQTMSTTGVSKFRPVSAKRSNELWPRGPVMQDIQPKSKTLNIELQTDSK